MMSMIKSTLNGMIIALSLLATHQAVADKQNLPAPGAGSPEAIEYNYILDEVESRGDKGNELDKYARECSNNGICRYQAKKNETIEKPSRRVVYQTPYGKQTVVYPH